MTSLGDTAPGPARQAVRVASTQAGVARAAEAFDAFRAAHGLSAHTWWRVQVALDEVLANIVRHGYGSSQGGAIDIAMQLGGGLLEIRLEDDAPPFDPLGVAPPDRAAPIEARRPGGLGVALTRALVDQVEYERRGGRNHLTLRLRVEG